MSRNRFQQTNDEHIKPIGQTSFASGQISDLPISDIPEDAVAQSRNWILYPDHAEVRGGTLEIGSLPTTVTGISATKTGTTITVTAGHSPADADVGFYFIWGDTAGANELITARSGSTYTVTSSTAHTGTVTGCKLRAELNAHEWHPVHKKHVVLCGQKLYSAAWNCTTWTEIYCTTPDELPVSEKCSIVIYENDALLFNSGGIYKIEISATVPEFYKVNITNNKQRVGDSVATDTYPYVRRYLYTMTKQSGNVLNDRLTNSIIQETTPNDLDDTGRDFGQLVSERPLGDSRETYAVLTGGTLDAACDAPADWESITNAQCKFTANGVTREVYIDFSGCLTFLDIADRIQAALRDYWPSALFEYDADHFVFTMPNASDTINYTTAGSAGTDISGAGATNYLEMITGEGTITNPSYYDESTLVLTSPDFVEDTGYTIGGSVTTVHQPHAVWWYNDVLYAMLFRLADVNWVVKSTDFGTTWTEVSLAQPWTPNYGYYAYTVYNNKMWVVCGGGAAGGNTVHYSTDGITWTTTTTDGGGGVFVARKDCEALSYNGKLWMMGGWESSGAPTYYNDVYYSTDGAAWTQTTAAAAWSARKSFGSVVFHDKMWVIGGSTSVERLDDVYYSTDGITWTQATASAGFGGREDFACFVLNDRIWVIGGYAHGGGTTLYYNDIWYSADGITWNKLTTDIKTKTTAYLACTSDNNTAAYLFPYAYSGQIDKYEWRFHGSHTLQPPNTVSAGVYTYTNPYTHYSLYAPKDVGTNGINPQTGKGNNSELYIWLADIPMIKSFVVTTAATGVVTASKGTFTKTDIGSMLALSDGNYGIIQTFNTSGSVTWDQVSVSTSVGATIGTKKPFVATQATYTVTASLGTPFASGSVGKRIFWSDGTTSIITAYTSSSVVTVADSTTRTAMGGGIIESTTTLDYSNYRRFNDIITDAELDAHKSGYILNNRFWQPLPDCETGVINGGFCVAAQRNGRKIYYTQLSSEWMIGSHNPFKQYDTTDDGIRLLITNNNMVSALCFNSTKTWYTDVTLEEEIKEIGEYVTMLAVGKVVDNSIGVTDWQGVTATPNGIYIMKTSNNGIMLFDGEQYSPDLAANRLSKKIVELEQLSAVSYDNRGGYYIWSTNTSPTTIAGVARLPFPDKCYRFAIDESQGVVGGIEIYGDGWLQPPNGIRGLQITDGNNYAIQTIFDNLTGKLYWLSTYDGSTNSGLNKVFLDKYNGATGTEISSQLYLRGHVAQPENTFLTSLNHHLFFRPNDEANRGDSGYDSDGYRSGLEIDLTIYKDRDPSTSFSSTANVDKTGEIVFDEQIGEAHTWQVRIAANRSELIFDGSLHYYASKDKSPIPSLRLGTEQTYQANLGMPEMWYGRNKNLYLDLSTGVAVSGTATGATGPDGKSNSAFTIAVPLTLASANITSGTVLLWRTGTVALTIGGDAVALSDYGTSGSWTLSYADTVTKSGAVVLTPTGSVSIADVRVYETAISAAEKAYYYNDVINNSGKNIMPRW